MNPSRLNKIAGMYAYMYKKIYQLEIKANLITKQNQIIHIQMFHMLLSIKLSNLGRIVALNIFPSIPKSLKKKPKESYKKNKDK